MAVRPLVFGARFTQSGRTVRVRARSADRSRYVVEVERGERPARRREHGSLTAALADFAAAWRARLH